MTFPPVRGPQGSYGVLLDGSIASDLHDSLLSGLVLVKSQ